MTRCLSRCLSKLPHACAGAAAPGTRSCAQSRQAALLDHYVNSTTRYLVIGIWRELIDLSQVSPRLAHEAVRGLRADFGPEYERFFKNLERNMDPRSHAPTLETLEGLNA